MLRRVNQVAQYVSVLLIFSMLNGCSVAGYHLGKAVDYSSASHEQVPDLEHIMQRDVVRVTLTDESKLLGIVERVTMDSLYLSTDETMPEKELYKHRKDDVLPGKTIGFSVNSLQSIEKTDYAVGGRFLFTTFGIVADVYILAIAILLHTLDDAFSNF